MDKELIIHKQRLININSRRLRFLEIQKATLGIHCKPEVLIEMEDIEKEIEKDYIELSKLEREEYVYENLKLYEVYEELKKLQEKVLLLEKQVAAKEETTQRSFFWWLKIKRG